jgi:hypothetical protein
MQDRNRPEDRGREDLKAGFLPDEEVELPNTSLLAYGVNRGSAVIRPEDEGKMKGLAVRAMEEQTRRELDMLEEQAKVLLAQANAIKRRKEISERIYTATMRFEPLIGRVYHLYIKEGSDILSLIAPHEWGRSKGYDEYVCKLRLLHDHTWEILSTES